MNSCCKLTRLLQQRLTSDHWWQATSSAVSPECRCSTHHAEVEIWMHYSDTSWRLTVAANLSVNNVQAVYHCLQVSTRGSSLRLIWLKCVFRLQPALAIVVFVQQHVEIWWCPERERMDHHLQWPWVTLNLDFKVTGSLLMHLTYCVYSWHAIAKFLFNLFVFHLQVDVDNPLLFNPSLLLVLTTGRLITVTD